MVIYPGNNTPKISNPTFSRSTPMIEDVIDSFEKITKFGDHIRVNTDNILANSGVYGKFNPKKEIRKTHFQGIARSYNSEYIYLSGGDHVNEVAQIFVLKLSTYLKYVTGSKTRFKTRAYGCNEIHPPSKLEDILENIFIIEDDPLYWHVGGISIWGEILVAPLEKDEKDGFGCKLKFYKTLESGNIKYLGDKLTIIADTTKAGATSLLRLSNGFYLCAIWADSNPHDNSNRRLRIYHSVSTNIMDGFKNQNGDYIYYDYPYVAAHSDRNPKYQAIHLIEQTDGQIFMLGSENSAAWAPIIKGADRLVPYLLDIKVTKDGNGDPSITSISLKQQLADKYKFGKKFAPNANNHNFDAGVGFYNTPKGELALYATFHWTRKGFINLLECYPNSIDGPISQLYEAIIELYSFPGFKKRSLRLYGEEFSTIPNYKKIKVQNKGFDDAVKSIRFILPLGVSYRLYEDKEYNDGDANKNYIELIGDGNWIEIPNLNQIRKTKLSGKIVMKYWNKSITGKISSSEFV